MRTLIDLWNSPIQTWSVFQNPFGLFLLNLLIPGAGTILMGRMKLGYAQFLLALTGGLIVLLSGTGPTKVFGLYLFWASYLMTVMLLIQGFAVMAKHGTSDESTK